MVAQFLRLKLRLLANSFRRSPWQVVGTVLGLLYGLGFAVFAFLALAGLRLVDVEAARSVVVTAGALVTLGAFIVPLFFGVDDPLDPRRFSLFGIDSTKLATALAVSTLIGVPAISFVVVGIGQVITWSRDPLAVLLAILSVPLLVATCLLGARVTTSLGAFVLSSRKARDATGVLAVLALMLLGPLFVWLSDIDWLDEGLGILDSTAAIVSWTPFGAVWSAPADAAAGLPGVALLKAIIAVLTVGALWVAWRELVAHMLVTPSREAHAPQYSGIGWFARIGGTPAGAIAARSITYWMRDARYLVTLAIVPVVPLIMIVPLTIAGVPTEIIALLPVPVVALFLGWAIHNDVAYDNTAIWLHVAVHIRGRDDRLGRAVPALGLGIPAVTVTALICAGIYGDWVILPAMLGVGFAVLFAGIGLSSVMSALFPYPAVRPGDSPFTQPQSGNTAAALIQALSFFATLLLAAPAMVLGIATIFVGGWYNWASLLVGVGFGLVCLIGGLHIGGRIFERRAPELLAFTARN